jgi:hypothetical protein
MALLRKISQSWPDQITYLHTRMKEKPSVTPDELKTELNVKDTHLGDLLKLKASFDPIALEKVCQTAKGNSSFNLSFNSAEILASLNGKVKDFPKEFQEALDLSLARHFKKGQIQALVTHIISGKPAKDFDPGNIPIKPKAPKRVVSPPAPEEGGEEQGVGEGAEESGEPVVTEVKPTVPTKTPGQWLDEFLAGLSNAPAAQAKNKKTSKTNLHLIARFIKWVWNHFWKFVVWLVSLPFRLLGKGFGDLIQGKFARGLVQMLFAALIFFALYWAWYHPGRILGSFGGFVSRCFSPWTTAEKAVPTTTIPPQSHEGAKKVTTSLVKTSSKVSLPSADRRPSSGMSPSTVDRRLSTITPALSVPTVVVPATLAVDTTFITSFIHDLYTLNYKNIEERKTNLQSMVSEDFLKDFTETYFNGDRVDGYHRMNEIDTLTLLEPVHWTMTYQNTEDFAVKGTVSMREDEENSKPQVAPISILVTITHDAGGQPVVVDIVDVPTK